MSSNKIDIVENGAIVKVFLLEAPLPPDAPPELVNSAGNFWDSFALTHAALGFLVEESESKHVIEFHANNFVGSFLPILPSPPPTPAPSPPPTPSPVQPTPSTSPPTASPTAASTSIGTPAPTESGGNFTEFPSSDRGAERREWVPVEGAQLAIDGMAGVNWDNKADVRHSRGFDNKLWTSATYVAKITGLLYNDINGWAETFLDEHPVYQPLSACHGSTAKSLLNDDPFFARGAADSYDFAWAAFERLASNGVIFEREVVLPPRRTAMCLFADGGLDAVKAVPAKGNEEALKYYQTTNDCVSKLAEAAAAGNSTYPGSDCLSHGVTSGASTPEGAVSLVLGLGTCLEDVAHAYVYHNESMLLRVPLPTTGPGGNGTVTRTTTGTAGLVRYIPGMPEPPPPVPRGSDRVWIVYVAVGVIAIAVAGFVARSLFRKRQTISSYGGAGNSSMFASGAGSDFGEFDGVGDGYERGLFPGDNYGSGSLPGGMHSSSSMRHGRMNWRGSRERSEVTSSSGENVELKRPLLHLADSPFNEPDEQQPPPRSSSSSRTRPSGGFVRRSSSTPSSRDQAAGGGRGSDSEVRGGAGVESRGSDSGRGRPPRDDVSPPPFSRMHGTIGAGPSLPRKRRSHPGGNRTEQPSAGEQSGVARSDEADRGPFDEDPFVGGGEVRQEVSESMKASEPEGDEVFC